ncbi:hypothetical protein MRB53_022801 [Persea americana]|uniref:Uncharacterized protein n=1 Tax=Persea americana TaxID=3435 RepID=A0ACC2L8K3_PERAE|nr:hypothetical protein MRB53_022801 [Persea americana]
MPLTTGRALGSHHSSGWSLEPLLNLMGIFTLSIVMLAMVLLVMYSPLPLSVFTHSPAAASHTCKSSTSIFDIPPDISLPIPTPEHVGVVPDTLLMVMFKLGRARLIPYLFHPLFTATKSSPLSM